MSAGRAVALFLLGLLLALLAFPVAYAVSAGLGYLMAITALAIGAYMAARRGGRALPLALGVTLAALSVVVIAVTAAIHFTAYAVSKALETKTAVLEARPGQSANLGIWRLAVLEIIEAKYIKHSGSYYAALEGTKAVLIRLRVENVGHEARSPALNILALLLVTDANKSYERVSPYHLRPIWEARREVIESAAEYVELDMLAKVAPGARAEGHLLFLVPEGEKPKKLHVTYWPP
jgi:hypothetical protein